MTIVYSVSQFYNATSKPEAGYKIIIIPPPKTSEIVFKGVGVKFIK